MALTLAIHPLNPQPRFIAQAAAVIRKGGVMVYPTDSAYALGCAVGNKAGMESITRIRQVDNRHNFTLVCRDLSEIATYARVDNATYRLLKAHTPAPYTFILKATSDVPRLLQHAKRKTIGIRVPEHPVVAALLASLDGPLVSSTLILPGESDPLIDMDEIERRLSHQVDLIIDSGFCGLEATTVIDLEDGAPQVLRRGKGDPAPFE
ncbi:MAG: threonylcarbamoyl-AMP synthase [Pseudomonadales bacterium]|jgi:tRNA threonylcarbamoyl adenosine modification protein (Sua5/YciO/YrdC/YwlC family)|nr:threonylcarbamoyl-AMP synthase [Pseudomonadales bacterium]